MSDSPLQQFMEGKLDPDEEAELIANDPVLARELRASMYIDGELSPEETAAFEAELLASADLRAQVEALSAIDAVASVPRTDEHARSAVDATDSAPRTDEQAGPEPAPERLPARVTASRPAPRRPVWAFRASALAAVAAVASVGLLILSSPGPDGLTIQVRPTDGPRFRTQTGAKVGDVLRIEVPTGDHPYTALRVYGAGRQVVGCPGNAGCFTGRDSLGVELTAEQRGTYEILWVGAAQPIPPSLGSADDDASALEGAADTVYETVFVQ